MKFDFFTNNAIITVWYEFINNEYRFFKCTQMVDSKSTKLISKRIYVNLCKKHDKTVPSELLDKKIK